MATETLSLAEKTPVEIDRLWVPIMERHTLAWQQRHATEQRIERIEEKGRAYEAYQLPELRERLEMAVAAVEATRLEAEPFQAEWRKRHGWSRFYLVTNGNGHVHCTTGCSTCYPTTQFAWLVELAGKTQTEMVAEFGEVACSICFPSAPSEYARLKAAGLLTANERRTAAEKAEIAAEKAAKRAAKEAKAITAPDGSRLQIGGRFKQTIATLVTAQRELTDAIAEQIRYGQREGLERLAAEKAADAQALLEAIAHKTGQTEAEIMEAHTEKARKKMKKDGW